MEKYITQNGIKYELKGEQYYAQKLHSFRTGRGDPSPTVKWI